MRATAEENKKADAEKKAADKAAFSVELAADKAPESKKPLSTGEAWESSHHGGHMKTAQQKEKLEKVRNN